MRASRRGDQGADSRWCGSRVNAHIIDVVGQHMTQGQVQAGAGREPLRTAVASGRRLKAVILGSADQRPQLAIEAGKLQPLLEKYVDVIGVDLDYRSQSSVGEADFGVVLGGDGSMLRAAQRLGSEKVPVIGVNLGRLGFLADVRTDELVPMVEAVLRGEFRLVDHMMLECQVFDDQRLVKRVIGLNELAVLGGPPFSMQHIDLYVDGDLATSYSCDGLIISTPVGSTAHNLSAGGPIVRKNLQAFVIAPISPHTLTVRPMVDTADRVYEVVVKEPNESTSAVVDGQVLCRLTSRHRVRVERAQCVFQLIEGLGHSYYRTLREKLGWSGGFRSQNQ